MWAFLKKRKHIEMCSWIKFKSKYCTTPKTRSACCIALCQMLARLSMNSLYARKEKILFVIRVPYMLNRSRFKRHKCIEHRKELAPEFIRIKNRIIKNTNAYICLFGFEREKRRHTATVTVITFHVPKQK